MKPTHIKTSLARVLESMRFAGPRRLPVQTSGICSPTLLDEYGDVRLTAKDHMVMRERVRETLQYENRHVVAFSLRETRNMSYYQIGLYFETNTGRARQMVVAGHELLLNSTDVQHRFPHLIKLAEARLAKIEERMDKDTAIVKKMCDA